MRPENKAEFDFLNVTQWHKKGYLGQGMKIAVFENDDKNHLANMIEIIKEKCPMAEIITCDKSLMSTTDNCKNFVDFAKKCIDLNVDIVACSFRYSYNEFRLKAWNEILNHGIPIIQSAGNEDEEIKPEDLRYHIPRLTIIGAVYLTDELIRFTGSNKGDKLDYVGISNLYTPSGSKFNATSCAEISACCDYLLLMQYMNTRDIWDVVDNNLLDLGQTGKDDLYGKGLFILPDLDKFKLEGDILSTACRDLNELLPHVKQLAEQLIVKCKEQGINIVITETYRSQERQNELYAQGRTKEGPVVTWTKTSQHTTRRAFDFVPVVNGQANYNDLTLFKRVGEIGKSLGLTWGGDWATTPDRPHMQYDGEIKEVIAVDEVSEWAKEAWEWAKNNGINDGNGAKNNVTEEQLMVFMYRFYKVIKG